MSQTKRIVLSSVEASGHLEKCAFLSDTRQRAGREVKRMQHARPDDMNFESWSRYIKLRFETKSWKSGVDSDVYKENYFHVFIMDKEGFKPGSFQSWVDMLKKKFDASRFPNNIGSGHRVIRSKAGEEVGLYVNMPMMEFKTFFNGFQSNFSSAISCVSKTLRELDEKELTECYEYGFFDGICDVEETPTTDD